jgi:hypothetical protein
MQVTALPRLLSYNLLCLIVDVVNWGFQRLSVLEIESSEHTSWAQVSLIDDKFLELSETELSFSDDFSFDIQDVVILNDSQIFVLMIISLVADTDHHKNVSGSLPHSVECALNIGNAVWNADFLFDFVFLVSDDFLGVIISSQIISFEVPFVIVSGFEPGNH